jgi:hypothetical protein
LNQFWARLLKVSPVDKAHIALLGKGQMHPKRAAERLRRVRVASHGDVIAQNLLILGVRAVLNNRVSAFARAFATKIGYA